MGFISCITSSRVFTLSPACSTNDPADEASKSTIRSSTLAVKLQVFSSESLKQPRDHISKAEVRNKFQ